MNSANTEILELNPGIRQGLERLVAELEKITGKKANTEPLINMVRIAVNLTIAGDENKSERLLFAVRTELPDGTHVTNARIHQSSKNAVKPLKEWLNEISTKLLQTAEISYLREVIPRMQMEGLGNLRPRHIPEDELYDWVEHPDEMDKPLRGDANSRAKIERDWYHKGWERNDKEICA